MLVGSVHYKNLAALRFNYFLNLGVIIRLVILKQRGSIMTTQTLAEAQKLIQNDLISGIVEDIITTSPIWQAMPWTPYTGQAILVNREETLGDSQHLAVGGTITAKAPSAVIQTPFTAVTTIGDAELNGLVAAQSASAGVNQLAVEIASKAKSVGRKLQQGMATGTGTRRPSAC